MSIEPTKQQHAIITFKGQRLVIKAGAGAAKTTTLRLYAEANPSKRMLFLSFNRDICEEAKQSFPSNTMCKTTHQVAFERFGRLLKHKLSGNIRLTQIANLLNSQNWQLIRDVRDTFVKYLCSADIAISDKHFTRGEKMKGLKGQVYKANVIDCTNKLWKKAANPNDDFPCTHDVYLKLYQLSSPKLAEKFDVILFDEVQDANELQSDIVLKQKCGLFLVGDDHQQIYRWRHAKNALELLSKQGAEIKYLTKSFRFGENIANVANAILAYKSMISGCDPFVLEGHGNSDTVDEPFPKGSPYTVLHRTVFGTIETALQNLDKKVYWIGGIKKYDVDFLMDVYHLSKDEHWKIKDKKRLEDFEDYQQYVDIAKATEEHEMNRAVRILDKFKETLPRKIAELIKSAESDELVADIIVSTAHRSKGLEFEYVMLADDFADILDPESELDTEEVCDELNLAYVASTRAMKGLQTNSIVKNLVLGHKTNFKEFRTGNNQAINDAFGQAVNKQVKALERDLPTYNM